MTCSDIAYLTIYQIKNDIITYEKMRTHKTIIIPLSVKSKEIIDYYHEKCYFKYVLPVFSAKHQTAKQQRERIERLSFKADLTMKKVYNKLSIEKK